MASKLEARASKDLSNNGKEKMSSNEVRDISSQFGAPFPNYTEEEGEKYVSLTKRHFANPRYFDYDRLEKLGLRAICVRSRTRAICEDPSPHL